MAKPLTKLAKICSFIAFIIFLTALTSDFSVKMFYSSPDPMVKVEAGLIAISIVASLLFLSLLMMPELQEPFIRIFGMNDDKASESVVQPLGSRRRKNRLTAATNILLLVITLVSVIFTGYFGYSNQQLNNSIYNYSPFFFSNYSSTPMLQNQFFSQQTSYVQLTGYVSIDLKVLSPNDGTLTLKVENLNFTGLTSPYDPAPNLLDLSLLKCSTVSFYGAQHQPEYFITKGVITPIEDRLFVQVNIYLNMTSINKTFGNGTSVDSSSET